MKYVGSKVRLSKDLIPIIQEIIDNNNINTYIEPFVGGANMIDKVKCPIKIGYDNNKYLISMWNKLQDGFKIPSDMSREEYNDIKDNRESYPPELVSIAGFCATYNAKWFGGYAGIVHTKAGTVRNYYDEAKRNIEKQLPNVMDVEFIHKDYRDIETKNSLIYCDPPYESRTAVKDLYGKSFNHKEFWDWVREQSKDNIVIVSEYNAPDDFKCIYEKGLNNTMNNNGHSRATEKLFTYQHNNIIR